MNRNLTIWSCAACAVFGLLGAAACYAVEVFPVVHSEPITVQVLAGGDGKPQARVHVLLTAGYNRRDLGLGMWQEDAVTDDDGRIRLSDGIRNLPLLSVRVLKRHVCGAGAGDGVLSVELIRRDGSSETNGCGSAVAKDAPGVFTVFVKSKEINSTPKPLSEQTLNYMR